MYTIENKLGIPITTYLDAPSFKDRWSLNPGETQNFNQNLINTHFSYTGNKKIKQGILEQIHKPASIII